MMDTEGHCTAEMATPENEALVARVYAQALEASYTGRVLAPGMQRVHDVEHLMQEVNSGVSFEQYFRWATLEEIGGIERHLAALGLERVRELTRQAMTVAFPKGLPPTPAALYTATAWTPAQEAQLAALFEGLEAENGHVTNVLAGYARTAGL
jgi:hypothetical protein